MKKEFIFPTIEIIIIRSDVITESVQTFGGSQAGDVDASYGDM